MIEPKDIRIGDLVRVGRDCAFPKGTLCAISEINSEKALMGKKGLVRLSPINNKDEESWGCVVLQYRRYSSHD